MTAGTWLTSPEVERAQLSLEGKVKLLMIEVNAFTFPR